MTGYKDSTMVQLQAFLAKSDGTTLIEHTKHVITACKNLLAQLPLEQEERLYWEEKVTRCALLHDIGKIHPDFQDKLSANSNYKVSIRHEIISLWMCSCCLEIPLEELFAIATHHKGVISSHGNKRLEISVLTEELKNHLEKANNLLSKSQEILRNWSSIFSFELHFKEILLINGHNELSIELKKCLNQMHQKKIPIDRMKLAQTRALLIASDHLGSARLENQIPCYVKIEPKDFQPKDKEGNFYPFRQFQEQLQNIKSDVILHAPTGSGKTEASLSWVFANQQENARLFYLLPYTASINAMVNRLQLVFGKDKVTALHSKALDFFYEQLADEESNEGKDNDFYIKAQQQAKSQKSISAELYYPVKVATPHQILKNALMGKGWEMSLFDYKEALFIIDEFHTYDALLTGLIFSTVKWLKKEFNAKIFFMSATIPEFMVNLLIHHIYDGDSSKLLRPNPEFENNRQILDRKRHQLICKSDKCIMDDISIISKLLREGKSVLVIVNNVKSCQKIYNEIEFNGSKRLLHGGFNRRSRGEIEKEITNNDKSLRPQMLIATQAVEVSLDIDYDVAFIENAPIDALIQRFGRVNRAGSKDYAPIFLYENSIGRTPFYNKEILESTWNTLLGLDLQYLSEQDLVNACNEVYKSGYNEEQLADFKSGLDNDRINNFNERLIAGHWEDWIEEILEKSHQKIEILCSNLIDEYDELLSLGRYIEANQLLVSVYSYELKDTIVDKKDNKRKAWIAHDFIYDDVIGYYKTKGDFEERSL